MGRGVGRPHTTSTTESVVPIVGIDYFYIKPEGVRRRDELAKELSGEGDEAITQARASGEVIKCLLVRCFCSKNLFAHVLPQKGDDEDITLMHECMISLDAEASIKLVLRNILHKRILHVDRCRGKSFFGSALAP